MSKERVSIPAKTRDTVLQEYNHRCAVCGADRPHIHHIDEDPSNNSLDNLLPLCPNCHLTDQHDPTRRIDAEKLRLFRRHKDPAILRPEFHPLFLRLNFLLTVEISEIHTDDLEGQAEDLADFVKALQMGDFYGERIRNLTKRPPHAYFVSLGGPDPEYERLVRCHNLEYRQQLVSVTEKVVSLAVELLRYQPWR